LNDYLVPQKDIKFTPKFLFYLNHQKLLKIVKKVTRWTLSEEWDGGFFVLVKSSKIVENYQKIVENC
jgi:hypothetical protein